MSLYWSTTKAAAVYVGSTAASVVYLGETPVWRPTVAPVTTEFTTVGTTSYTIPAWCDYLDIIVLGGGQGGGAGTVGITGSGGYAGNWSGQILTRGTSFSWSETSVSVTVGGGGAKGTSGTYPNPGATGGSSIASVGAVTITGTSNSGTSGNVVGASPGNFTLNSISYTGGSTAAQSQDGKIPGGGGGGGAIFNGLGGNAARGQVWIRAYQKSY